MGRQRCRVGFYVEVEVEAHPRQAWLVAERACGWPGDWLSTDPVETTGELDGNPVTARIIRTRPLMVTVADAADRLAEAEAEVARLRRQLQSVDTEPRGE